MKTEVTRNGQKYGSLWLYVDANGLEYITVMGTVFMLTRGLNGASDVRTKVDNVKVIGYNF